MGSPDDRQPLVVMSNRLPFTVSRTQQGLECRPSPGGLVSALDPVLRRRGGTWIGWPGIELREDDEIPTSHQDYPVAPVPLSDAEIQRYYHGFSNRTLWPLCHSLPAMASFERKDWLAYQRVNERFADVAVEHAGDSAMVWVQDYHLMLTPERIRLGAPEARLAFFFHIPFPPYDIFRLCPWDRELLQGMLSCDLIGFHVEGYAQNFLECAEKRLGARVDRKNRIVEYGDLSCAVDVFPIGIEFGAYENAAKEAPAARRKGERIVLGVDRLDYTKGIPNRIRAFEKLLELHPEHREQVTYLQLAVPSRSQVAEYRELKREIDELVGRVNGRFASAAWSPIRYLYRSLSQERLTAMYRDADVALVTPLRDGMNLVAKEYVACQVEDPGVLILSRMAGAAETMREALFVNPYNVEETAEAIHRGLTMAEEERASRMTALRRRERRDDVEAWVSHFLEAAAASHERLQPLTRDEVDSWLAGYIRDYRLVLFLDYDGTLTPLQDHPSEAVLSPEMRRALDRCAGRSDTEIAVVSGRSISDIQKIVGTEGLIYAGNHGLEIQGPGVGHFRHDDLVHYRDRAVGLAEELSEIEEGGAWTEAKGPTLTFHVRAVAEKQRAELLDRARAIISRAGYQARQAHAALEARPPIGWDKGRAVLHILRDLHGPSWSEKVRVVYIGDDETDEDAFRFLAGLSLTFRVGSAETLTGATRRLPNVGAVRAVLEWIGERRSRADRRLEPVDLAVLGTAALLTSALSAVAGLGGGIVLIAILLLYLDPLVAIPVHGAIQLASNASRTWMQRRHVDLGRVGLFAALLVPASWLGLQLLSSIPPGAGRAAIGVFVLLATWWPRGLLLGLHPERLDPRRRFLGLGAVAGLVNVTFGAAGPLLGPFFRGIGLSRQGVVGTFAACQSLGHGVKIVLFVLAGFAFRDHALLLVLATGLVVVGTALGSRALERVSEASFQKIYLAVLTLVALRLVGGEVWSALS